MAECCANTRSAGKKKGRGNHPFPFFARGEDWELRGERGEGGGDPTQVPTPSLIGIRRERSEGEGEGEVKRATTTTTTRSSLCNSLSRWNLTTSRRRRACQQPTLRELPILESYPRDTLAWSQFANGRLGSSPDHLPFRVFSRHGQAWRLGQACLNRN